MNIIEEKLTNFMKKYQNQFKKTPDKINWTLVYDLIAFETEDDPFQIVSDLTGMVIDKVHPEDYMKDIPDFYASGLILKDDQIHLREGIKTIGAQALQSTDIKELIIPSTVISIGEACFDDCSDLEVVIFKEPCQLRKIPKEAFMNCVKLKSITLPLTISRIGKRAFAFSALETITLHKGLHISNYAFEETPLKEIIFKGRKEDFNLQVHLSAKALEGCPIHTITCDNGEIDL